MWRCLVLVVLVACGSKSEKAPVSSSGGKRLEIVYDIDLDKAIDDRLTVIRADLAAKYAVPVKASITGVITVPVPDPTKRADVQADLKSTYGDVTTPADCAPEAGPSAVCFTLGAAEAVRSKQAALAMAVDTIKKRLDPMKIDVTVASRGEQIVISLGGSDDRTLAAIHETIPRGGNLAFKVVDDNAPFMQRVYSRVAGTRDGGAQDPAASAVGVRAEIDQWRTEDGVTHRDYYLTAPDRSALEKYLRDLAIGDPSYRVPDDRTFGFEHVEGKPAVWRSYYLERESEVGGKDIAEAEVSRDPNLNRAIVLVDFTRAGTEKFAALTGRIAGKKLATILDGTIKSAPVVNSAIRGGRVSITMGGTDAAAQDAEAKTLRDVLAAGALPAPLRQVSEKLRP